MGGTHPAWGAGREPGDARRRRRIWHPAPRRARRVRVLRQRCEGPRPLRRRPARLPPRRPGKPAIALNHRRGRSLTAGNARQPEEEAMGNENYGGVRRDTNERRGGRRGQRGGHQDDAYRQGARDREYYRGGVEPTFGREDDRGGRFGHDDEFSSRAGARAATSAASATAAKAARPARACRARRRLRRLGPRRRGIRPPRRRQPRLWRRRFLGWRPGLRRRRLDVRARPSRRVRRRAVGPRRRARWGEQAGGAGHRGKGRAAISALTTVSARTSATA